VGFALGPAGLGWFKDDVSRAEFRALVDLTLALILFSDVANSNLSVLRKQWQLPTRMLMIGLPGAIGLGIASATWIFDFLTIYEAAILAATDAALGVLNEDLPGGAPIVMVVICTVGLSLIAHGISANPLAAWIARKEEARGAE